MDDKTCLTYWHPQLVEHGIPTPTTMSFRTNCQLDMLCDGDTPDGYAEFMTQLTTVADFIGYPLFLRTGLTSGKHDWENTCYVSSGEDLERHVANLVVFSNMVDLFGLPTDIWVCRQFLQLRTAFSLPCYGNMPLAREFRGFINKREVQCIHPYWPIDAVEQGKPTDPEWREKLRDISQLGADENDVRFLLARVADIFPDHWSVDVCQTRDGGWLVTDMAEGDRSFHWKDCPNGDCSHDEPPGDRLRINAGVNRKAMSKKPPGPDCPDVSRVVKQIRNELDLTQKDVADKAGLCRGRIADIESAHCAVSIETLAKVSRALDKKPSEVLKLAGW